MRRDGIYYECHGAAPSNVIVKPGVTLMDGQASIEHLTMEIAREIGLPVAKSDIVDFDGTSAIVVERYDRIFDNDGRILRLHQEDFCQALGLLPQQKYMDGKNPTIVAAQMLQQHCSDKALSVFIDSIMFNYLIGGTDGHLKNHSLLYKHNGIIDMAPLYDMASQFPYMRRRQITHLALGIGTEKRIGRVGKKALTDMSKYLGIPSSSLIARFETLASAVPEATDKVFSISSGIPNIEQIRDAMLPRVTMNCQYAERNLHTSHFVPPSLYEATGGISLDDGDKYADLQEELMERNDSMRFRDPETGIVHDVSVYTTSSAQTQTKNRKHQKVSTGAYNTRAHGDGPVYVQPHVRGGKKIRGYWRSRPNKK